MEIHIRELLVLVAHWMISKVKKKKKNDDAIHVQVCIKINHYLQVAFFDLFEYQLYI
jgi:hypothetical protein